MKNIKAERLLAAVLALVMTVSMVLVFTVAGSAQENTGVYTLDAADLNPFAAGAKYDGEYVRAGSGNYFTVIYSEKTKLETNDKNFSDGFAAKQRFSWGAKTEIGDAILNAVKIKTAGSATVKLWWVGGDSGRNPAIFAADGSVVVKDTTSTEKNALYITELQIPEQGIYYIGNLVGSNYFYKIQVTDSGDGTPEGDRAAWAGVAAPAITSATDNGAGQIEVKINALIGHDGADELFVSMYSGEELIATKGSVTEKGAHTLLFAPADSGKYTFKAELTRAGEESKTSASVSCDFVYVLEAPYLSSATSKGGGSIEIKWGSVHEAESYNIYQDGVKVGSVAAGTLSYIASGLTIDKEYSFEVSAIRGSEELKSNKVSTVASKDQKAEWGFTVYGPSTDGDNNGYVGSINDKGWVTVYSEGGKGKIQPTSVDGLAFYYTAVPTEYNFTLRAKVSVDSWKLSNGQEGFGLLVTDRLGENGNKDNVWNNSYLAGSTKIEYKYDSENDELIDIKVVNPSLLKFSMKLGIGTVARTGITKDNLPLFEAQDTETINKYFVSRNYTLERQAADICGESGTYNVIGKFTDTPAGSFEERFLITEYIMEIQKNNSGYFISYYDAETKELISQKKFYDPEALNHLDEDYVYAGFFASRNARVTYSDVEFSTILASEDAPREYPDPTYVNPNVTVSSGTVTTKENYEFIVDSNVAGTLNITYEDEVILEDKYVEAYERYRTTIDLKHYEINEIKVLFTPDPDQWLGDFVELSSTNRIIINHEVTFNIGNYHRKTIYISPDVMPYTTTADGTRENPFDIFTAIENAYPGQTLILMEGTYKPGTALKIQRGMDGTADEPIRLIADPEAKTRPVIDFEELYAGLTHGGDYWYFYGFDVTGSSDMQKGFQVSGNYNVLDQIHTYENGNTGIQICRLSGSDLFEDWPHDNLILNCTSYRNFDSGFEDADGFAAKLTVGNGNVFDGCIAYNNADDGWDLYAKVETGPIGAVTIRNCISYENGFVPGEGSKTGNGNGFKMGGESLSGKHVIENSIAFNNLMKGIDCNSCPDIIVKDCIGFNNGSHNFAFYTNNAANTAFVSNGAISFRTEKFDLFDNLKGKGSQVDENYKNDSTYYYFEGSTKSMNTLGVEITADMFVSLEYTGWERNENGTINLKGFLEINDKVPANAAGCKLGGQASYEITLVEDEDCSFKPNWYNIDKYAHWHYCDCGNKTDVEEHSFIWIIDKPVEGNSTGSKHEECLTCGYKKPAITIYPESSGNTPDVDEPDVDNPDVDGPAVDQEEPMNFFEMIWQWILDFLRSIFPGLFPAEE